MNAGIREILPRRDDQPLSFLLAANVVVLVERLGRRVVLREEAEAFFGRLAAHRESGHQVKIGRVRCALGRQFQQPAGCGDVVA